MSYFDPDTPAVRVAGLSHRYPKATVDALAEVAFTVAPGDAFVLLGPNGGGKSTVFRILATLLQPQAARDTPTVNVFGRSVLDHPAAVRRELGVVFQSPSLDGKLTARENLYCHGRLYGMTRRSLPPRVDELLERFGLLDRADDYAETFSGGMRRRLEVAKALLPGPRLLLLDEPSTGLDPEARRAMWDTLFDLRERDGLTLAWTTHLMDEAERADRVGILAAGRLLAVDTPGALKARVGGEVVTVEPRGDEAVGPLRDAIAQRLGPWAPADAGRAPTVTDRLIRFEHPQGAAVVPELAAWLGERVRRVSVGPPSLEDAYFDLTRPANIPSNTDAPAALALPA